ncbi:MAG: glycosyltransferase family 4 protein [Thermodesulfovibrionales bacterium]|nr:glycosyltransferase family 4 protein [Thermodesulfovibrionales bacterium]
MNIGLVSVWWNRGQATVARMLRAAFDEMGHNTFVLARPTKDKSTLSKHIATNGVWAQEGVTHASDNTIPLEEYTAWARDNSLDAVFVDENYQFEEIEAIRKMGVRTHGRYVWERFSESHVESARRALDTVYSLTLCEQERYAAMGIESPYIRWCCPPEMVEMPIKRREDGIYFFFPGSFLGQRKPIKMLVEAFKKLDAPDARLIIKGQGYSNRTEDIEIEDDPRIELIVEDMPLDRYMDVFATCHVCMAPSRFEGLGLHFFESMAVGMPVVTNDIPPHNEVVRHKENGYLLKSVPCGTTKSGITTYDPDPIELLESFRYFSDPARVEEHTALTLKMRQEFSWNNTVSRLREVFSL